VVYLLEHTKLEIVVYGAEQICASCVGAPSSLETYEWLGTALSRKFPDQPFDLTYVDIFKPNDDSKKQEFAKQVIEDNIYPVVVINDKVVAEGTPRLKPIYAEMEKYGYKTE
jgi:disulfide oxidoreductase YuzD